MGFAELFLLAVGLSMDAATVLLAQASCRQDQKVLWQMAALFALFQGGMPVLGYGFGSLFGSVLENIGGIVTTVVLIYIGGAMCYASFHPEEDCKSGEITLGKMLGQAIATSIDAAAVGIGFRAQQLSILQPAVMITVVTFGCCALTIPLGRKGSLLLGERAECFGGIMLILLGLLALRR